jgi:hypothetical protein
LKAPEVPRASHEASLSGIARASKTRPALEKLAGHERKGPCG